MTFNCWMAIKMHDMFVTAESYVHEIVSNAVWVNLFLQNTEQNKEQQQQKYLPPSSSHQLFRWQKSYGDTVYDIVLVFILHP